MSYIRAPKWLLSLLVVVGLALHAAAAWSDEPVKISVGWITTPGQLTPILFAKPGLAKHMGVSYRWEPAHFDSSPPEITALASGQIEIASMGFSTLSYAVLNAGLKDMRIVADEVRDGANGYYSLNFMVLKDSGINKVEDLKGKVLATIGIGSGADIGMSAMLVRHGLRPRIDYTLVEVPFPNMNSVLLERKADLVTTTNPFVLDPKLQAAARSLFTLRDGMGVSELSFWAARADFIAQHRAAVVDLLEDYVRAVRWYTDPANHKEAIDYASSFTKIPPERFDAWAFTKLDNYRDPNGLPDIDVLKNNIKTQRDLGLLKENLDVDQYVDLSLVKEAVQRLK